MGPPSLGWSLSMRPHADWAKVGQPFRAAVPGAPGERLTDYTNTSAVPPRLHASTGPKPPVTFFTPAPVSFRSAESSSRHSWRSVCNVAEKTRSGSTLEPLRRPKRQAFHRRAKPRPHLMSPAITRYKYCALDASAPVASAGAAARPWRSSNATSCCPHSANKLGRGSWGG
jgi:hypothetical protein